MHCAAPHHHTSQRIPDRCLLAALGDLGQTSWGLRKDGDLSHHGDADTGVSVSMPGRRSNTSQHDAGHLEDRRSNPRCSSVRAALALSARKEKKKRPSSGALPALEASGRPSGRMHRSGIAPREGGWLAAERTPPGQEGPCKTATEIWPCGGPPEAIPQTAAGQRRSWLRAARRALQGPELEGGR